MILDDIVARRREQLQREKAAVSPEEMAEKARNLSAVPCRDFASALSKPSLGVIAEVKRSSPSKGRMVEQFDPAAIAQAYESAGADAVSVLTEEHYFEGSAQILRQVREAVQLPILRKDFIIDPYQIDEARVIGADAVLLIAALHTADSLKSLLKRARSLGLACLTEVHNEAELSRALRAGCPIIGINNRDLTTFQVDLNTTAALAAQIPKGRLIVSESGMKSREDLAAVKQAGAHAVLIGEALVTSGKIGEALCSLREGL